MREKKVDVIIQRRRLENEILTNGERAGDHGKGE